MIRSRPLRVLPLALVTIPFYAVLALCLEGCADAAHATPAHLASPSDEQAAARAKAKEGAVALATNVATARDQLSAMVQAMESGQRLLAADRKFPVTLAHELEAIHIEFDARQLGARSFVGFSPDIAADLVDFVTAVHAIKEKKQLIQLLLLKLEKPIAAQLARPPGQFSIEYAVAVDRDPAGNMAGFLVHLSEPIVMAAGGAIALPAQFTFADPAGGGSTALQTYKGGNLAAKPAAIYIVPKTFDRLCPTATAGQAPQLVAQIGSIIDDVKGVGDALGESRAGMIERANKLIKELGTVGS
jgi:hypothetical protein